MNPLPSDLLSMFVRIGSLLVGACGCAEDAKSRKPANMGEKVGPTIDGAVFICTHVLTGAIHPVGAGPWQKTPVCHRNRKPFRHTTSKQERTTKHG